MVIRQSFQENKLLLTLQVHDVLGTDQHESFTYANDFYAYRLYSHRAPIVILNLTLRINNFGKNRDDVFGGGRDDYGAGGEM